MNNLSDFEFIKIVTLILIAGTLMRACHELSDIHDRMLLLVR
jgi:hypothetical protein